MLKTFTRFDSRGLSLVRDFAGDLDSPSLARSSGKLGAALMDHEPEGWGAIEPTPADASEPTVCHYCGQTVDASDPLAACPKCRIEHDDDWTREDYREADEVEMDRRRKDDGPAPDCSAIDRESREEDRGEPDHDRNPGNPNNACPNCGRLLSPGTGPVCPECQEDLDELAEHERREQTVGPTTRGLLPCLHCSSPIRDDQNLCDVCEAEEAVAGPLEFEPIIASPFHVGRRVLTRNRPGDLWIPERTGTIVERRDLGDRPAFCVLYDGENGGGRHEPGQLELLDEPDRVVTADEDHEDGYTVADEPHPNALWNYGHVHGLEGYGPRPLDEWSDEAKRAYANGHRSGTLNRETNERAEASRIQRQHTARDEAYKAGYDAALADAQPSPPTAYSDDLKGSWLEGYGEGNQILIARFNDHLAEEEAKFEYLSLHESATNFGGF